MTAQQSRATSREHKSPVGSSEDLLTSSPSSIFEGLKFLKEFSLRICTSIKLIAKTRDIGKNRPRFQESWKTVWTIVCFRKCHFL